MSYVDRFAQALPRAEWLGTAERPTIAFVGRIDEPRKGLQVLMDAVPAVLQSFPGLRRARRGHRRCGRGGERPGAGGGRRPCTSSARSATPDKAALLRSVDAYVAPHTGGESFGIVLVEAMSAGAPVVASDLSAFRRVLDDGRCGELFAVGDAARLGCGLGRLLRRPAARAALAARRAREVRRYDWPVVAGQILDVYATVTS